MDALKIFLIAMLSAIFAFFEPIYNPIKALFCLFLLDMLAGLIKSIMVNGEGIRLKKILFAIAIFFAYNSLVVTVYMVGFFMGSSDYSFYVIRALTYICIAGYFVNVLKNFTLIFPHNRVLAFIYYAVGLKMLEKLPVLYRFLFGPKTPELPHDNFTEPKL